MNQLAFNFSDVVPASRVLGGVDARDVPRLTGHLKRVLNTVTDGEEWTLERIAKTVGCSQPSASARLRDLRKLGYTVTSRRDEEIKGLNHYRVT